MGAGRSRVRVPSAPPHFRRLQGYLRVVCRDLLLSTSSEVGRPADSTSATLTTSPNASSVTTPVELSRIRAEALTSWCMSNTSRRGPRPRHESARSKQRRAASISQLWLERPAPDGRGKVAGSSPVGPAICVHHNRESFTATGTRDKGERNHHRSPFPSGASAVPRPATRSPRCR